MHKLIILLLLLGAAAPSWARDDGSSPPVITQAMTKLFPRLEPAFDELGAGDILVLDLDNTVFREAQMLGTDEWYSYIIAQMTAAGLTQRQAAEELEATNRAIKSASKMSLMEEGMPALIADLQSRGVAVIGLTARHPNLAEITLRQLNELGIHFGASVFPAVELLGFRIPNLQNDFSFEGGVAFSDGSPKGKVLSAMVKKTGVNPRRIYAIDDRIHHVHTFVESMLELGVHGRVVHYLRAHELPFDAAIAGVQLAEFKKTGRLLSDEEAATILACESALAARLK